MNFSPLVLFVLTILAAAPSHVVEPPAVAPPQIASHADVPEDFVPAGWRIEHRVDGRIDDDTHDDVLLLLRMDDPANVIDNDGLGSRQLDTNPRMLVVAFSDGKGGWRRVLMNHALIPRRESPTMADYLQDDPAGSITLQDNRSIRISLHSFASAGSWYMGNTTFTFRHQDGCFRLIGYDATELHRASMAMKEVSINYLTGRALVSEGSAEEEALPKRWQRLSDRSRICIEDVGDGFLFEPKLSPP
ncbi:MAG: hypothetical protein NVV60_04540 [Luteimonas sp.]|nr:hypothetical protein [Luteimonas sp.]